MKPIRFCLPILAGTLFPLAFGQQARPQPKSQAAVSGVFTGRSGKPQARAKLFLGQVVGDDEVTYARIKLPDTLPSTVCDDQGRFQFKGVTPGQYTIVYQPAGAAALLPTEIGIKSFLAVTRSAAPGLRGMEFGANDSLAERAWGPSFTLLKGHTFFLEGQNMKLWNATIRRGQRGPYMEIRRGLIWLQRLEDKGQIKFEAWGY